MSDLIHYESLHELCSTTGININEFDWKDIGAVIDNKYIPLHTKKSRLSRIFNKSWLHGNMVRKELYGQLPEHVKNNINGDEAKTYMRQEPKSWCQSCDMNAYEDQTHMLAECNNEKSIQVRKKWLKMLLSYTQNKVPPVYNHIREHLQVSDTGALLWKGNPKKASLLLSGCVPSSWRETIDHLHSSNTQHNITQEQQKEKDKHYEGLEDVLHWLSHKLRKEIWTPFANIRSEHYTRRGDDSMAVEANFDTENEQNQD